MFGVRIHAAQIFFYFKIFFYKQYKHQVYFFAGKKWKKIKNVAAFLPPRKYINININTYYKIKSLSASVCLSVTTKQILMRFFSLDRVIQEEGFCVQYISVRSRGGLLVNYKTQFGNHILKLARFLDLLVYLLTQKNTDLQDFIGLCPGSNPRLLLRKADLVLPKQSSNDNKFRIQSNSIIPTALD